MSSYACSELEISVHYFPFFPPTKGKDKYVVGRSLRRMETGSEALLLFDTFGSPSCYCTATLQLTLASIYCYAINSHLVYYSYYLQ